MIHLRVRTEYSFKSTFCPIKRAVDRLKDLGVTHAGIVDLDGTWGFVQWQEYCRKAGIKPLYGVELIVSDVDDLVTTMWFLAKNIDGLRELYHLTSHAFRNRITTKIGPKPRLHRKDVIAMSDNVYKFAGDVIDEDFLVSCHAIVDINPASRILTMAKQAIVAKTNLKLVETCDNYYPYPEDKQNFELIEYARQKPTPQYITELKTVPDLTFEDFDLPRAPMIHAEGDLEKLCRDGIEFRVARNGLRWDEVYEARLQRELGLIRSKNFDSYFIIVSDMVREAKKSMLVGPSRGSSAGSLVCYLTRITEIDPVHAGLIFERFIDESRKDLPDIDIDFPGLKREHVFEYMRRVYTHVANIGTIQSYKAKSALIQVCKKLGIPPIATAATKAAIILRASGDARGSTDLAETLASTKAGQDLVKMYPEVIRAVQIENHASHTGTHAAGLILCNERIDNYCTIQDDGTAQVVKKTAEALNLLKVDILGLRTLDILEDSGVEVDWYALPHDDQATYDLFNKQALSSIFQFDGQSMRNLSSQIDFKSIHDIDAVTALARPGPFGGGVTAEWLERKKGKKYVPFHPLVEEHMKGTYGLPVYQEQTMAIVREIGKFDWTKVASIRQAVALKKGKDFFDSYWPNFLEGALEQGMTEAEAKRTWEYINTMGAYQMNKAHTYSYAVIGYWTAWLKAHHPAEFAAANLRHAKDEESALTMLQEMVREGTLKYQPFDPDISSETWRVEDGVLIAGFDSLKGFGPAKAKKFVEDRGHWTESQREQIEKAPSVFSELFPMHKQFAEYYNDPEKHNLMDAPIDLARVDGSQAGSLVFIGRLIQKNLRDANEDVNVRKRNGKLVSGPVTFLDFRIADDSDRIQCRIDRFKYSQMGKEIFEAPIGTCLLVRAHFMKGIRFGFVQKVRILETITAEEAERIALPEQKRFSFGDDND